MVSLFLTECGLSKTDKAPKKNSPMNIKLKWQNSIQSAYQLYNGDNLIKLKISDQNMTIHSLELFYE